MSRKIDGNLTKSGPVPSIPLRQNHEKQSSNRGRKHMLYVVFPPRFNMFPFRFHLRNQVISSCATCKWCAVSREIRHRDLKTLPVKYKLLTGELSTIERPSINSS